MAKLPGAYETLATVGAPAINFARGLLGYQDPFLTQTMQDEMARMESEKGPTGNIGYEDYGLDSSAGRFTGGLFDLAINNPVGFGLAGSVGKYSYSPEGRTGLKYDFTPDQDTGSTGSAVLDFINKGGLKGALNNKTLTVNDLIGLDYSNLRNPITPRQDVNRNQPFLNSSYPQPEFFPNDQQGSLNVDMGATGTVPTAAKLNAQPLIGETSGIAPLLISDTNMPLDYEEMIKKDSSIVTPPKKKIGLENILQLAISAAIPGAGFLMRAPKGLAGLNRRFRKNLDNFFDRRKYDGRTRDQAYANMITQTRGIQKKIDSGVYDDKGSGGIGDRGRGQTPTKTTSSKKSSSRPSRHTSGPGGLHSNY